MATYTSRPLGAEPRSDVDFYFASSPRHLLLAAGLALRRAGSARSHLFLIEHLPAASVTLYLDLLRGWPRSPFDSLQRLRADHRAPSAGPSGPGAGFRKRARKRGFRLENRRLIERAVREHAPDRILVGCDNYFESQFALHEAKRRSPDTRGALIEDGVAVYDYDFRARPGRAWRDVLRRWRYGSWWRPCPIVGTSGWLDEAWVAFPELVIDELQRLELHRLSAEVFRGPEFLELARSMALAFGVDLERLGGCSLLLAVTRSNVARHLPGYVDTILALCDALGAAGHSVAIKFHPREGDPGFLPLAGRHGVYVLPRAPMFELLVLLLRAARPTVVGDASTALLATRWLRPEARVIALRHGAGPAGRFLERPLRALGIPLEEDVRTIPERYLA